MARLETLSSARTRVRGYTNWALSVAESSFEDLWDVFAFGSSGKADWRCVLLYIFVLLSVAVSPNFFLLHISRMVDRYRCFSAIQRLRHCRFPPGVFRLQVLSFSKDFYLEIQILMVVGLLPY